MSESTTARQRPTGRAAATSLLLAGGLTLTGCSSDPEADGPADVLAAYEDARNSRDFDTMRGLYADDAVITGHPLDSSDPPLADLDEVMALEERVPMSAQSWFVDVDVSGDQATFTQLFRQGRGCHSTPGDQMTVADDKITSYTWAETRGGQPCTPEQFAEAGVEN